MTRAELCLRFDVGGAEPDTASASTAPDEATRVVTAVVTDHGGAPTAVGDGIDAVFDDPARAFEAGVLAQRAVQRSDLGSSVQVRAALDLSESQPTDAAAIVELANGNQFLVTGAVVAACPLADVRGLGPVVVRRAGEVPLWLSTDSRAHTSGLPLRAAPSEG